MAGPASPGKGRLEVACVDFEVPVGAGANLVWFKRLELPFVDKGRRRFGGKKQGFELLRWEWQLRLVGESYTSEIALHLLPLFHPQVIQFCAQWGKGALASAQGAPATLRTGFQLFELLDGSSGILTFHDCNVVLFLEVLFNQETSFIKGSVRTWWRPFWTSDLEYAKWDATYQLRTKIEDAAGVSQCTEPYVGPLG